eukprot:TRINITY_DN8785_c0_g1_i1.p1 TRINITY_DN8785_c0_g1~~TRINITY_DN8785_c0_g1_i1.p1  ORF type:complete len:312 (+),score=20.32 TRINITY_DN8785_c0_g1_i1:90-938(+)
MEGHSGDDEETPLVPFPSLLSDTDTQISPLESTDIGVSLGLDPVLVQTGPRNRTVTRHGVSPFALLQPPPPDFPEENEPIGVSKLGSGSSSTSSIPEPPATVFEDPKSSRRRRTSDVYRVYGLKHEVNELLWDGDPRTPSNKYISITELTQRAAPSTVDSLEIAAYRVREGELAERVYPCSHPNALSEPKSKRWRKRNPLHVDKFFKANTLTELLRDGEGGVATLAGTLACASPCWKCTERLQRFVILKSGIPIAYTDIIGVQASRARKGRPRKATPKAEIK